MAIEALYPSRRQSRRHNPLFRRERRARRLTSALTLVLGISAVLLPRILPGNAATETSVAKSESRLPIPAAMAQQRPVRVIPLYHLPQG